MRANEEVLLMAGSVALAVCDDSPQFSCRSFAWTLLRTIMRATITSDPRTECILFSFVVDDLHLAHGRYEYLP